MDRNTMEYPVITRATREAGLTLHGLLGVVELMRVAFAKGEIEVALNRLALLTSEAANLSSILGNILELTQFEAEPAERTCHNFDIIALVRDIVRTTKTLIGNKPVNVMDVLSPKPIMFFSDPLIIRKIINGLVINAITCTDRGRIALILNKDETTIKVTVTDTGRGMDREQINAVLLSSDRGREIEIQDISGLGLRIVKHHVGSLDGAMNISSKVGEGTIVNIILPLGKPDRFTESYSGKQRPQTMACARI